MKKQGDSKHMLFEMMEKVNPDFKAKKILKEWGAPEDDDPLEGNSGIIEFDNKIIKIAFGSLGNKNSQGLYTIKFGTTDGESYSSFISYISLDDLNKLIRGGRINVSAIETIEDPDLPQPDPETHMYSTKEINHPNAVLYMTNFHYKGNTTK